MHCAGSSSGPSTEKEREREREREACVVTQRATAWCKGSEILSRQKGLLCVLMEKGYVYTCRLTEQMLCCWTHYVHNDYTSKPGLLQKKSVYIQSV